MYRVLLADDEMLDLEGMRTFIPWNEMDMEVAGAVNSGFAACEVLDREKIDILVTDIRMPNMSGLELAKRALEKQERLRVIFVSGHQDFNYVKQAMSLNAHGYVLKPMDDKELIDALAKASRDLEQDKRKAELEASLPYAATTVHSGNLEALPNIETTKNSKLIASVITDVKANLHDNVTLKDLSLRYSFSPNYLGLLFKEETGYSFSDYLTKLRLDKARQLLSDTNLKIYEIAEQVGYRYFPYFSRHFREVVGMTPLEYRRRH